MTNVLPFTGKPKRTRARRSMDAAGMLTIQLLVRDGESVPANVRRIDQLDDADDTPERSPELLLALLLWNALPHAKRNQIKGAIRSAAFGELGDRAAVQLHNLLNGTR